MENSVSQRVLREAQGAALPRRSESPCDPGGPEAMTPMMAQYAEIKSAYPGCLLFYRMGDFFELFFDDAVRASRALGIQLTKRGKHLGEDIPMCGVPVVRADEYLQKLIACGFRIAVAEQMEDPAEAKKRGGKAVVRRDVIRLVTPGTITEEALLDAAANSFLTGLCRVDEEAYALASADISTGETSVSACAGADLGGELARLAPREVLLPESLAGDKKLRAVIDSAGAAITPLPDAYFGAQAGEAALKKELGVATLEAFGNFTRGELAAMAAVLRYVEITQIAETRPARAATVRRG
jgi:DNA mismatch repair protein MutS